MKRIFFYCCFMLLVLFSYGQAGKYFTASQPKCGTFKVFIDYRVQQYCGSTFSIAWDGTCKSGYADGEGKLTLISTVSNRSFTMTYEGKLVKGKKEGYGILNLFIHYPGFQPYYSYTGGFRNDEFEGYGEFKSDYPYPVEPDKVGQGVSLELLGLDLQIWRSDLFFYEYKGNFLNGKIADTEKEIGKTKRMRHLAGKVEYTGAIRNGRPNGKGFATEETIIALPNQQSYLSMSGNFVNARLNGYGKEEGRYYEYEGDFVDGVREGKGKATFWEFLDFIMQKRNPNLKEGRNMSEVIEGSFTNGQASGFCTIYYHNSPAFKYTGPLKQGKREGTGEIEYLDGSKLRGNFRDGKMEGEGAMIFADGERFSGQYSNDRPTRGIYYYKDGATYEGGFAIREERDKLTNKPVERYIRQGKGTITYKDGTKKEVTCADDNCN